MALWRILDQEGRSALVLDQMECNFFESRILSDCVFVDGKKKNFLEIEVSCADSCLLIANVYATRVIQSNGQRRAKGFSIPLISINFMTKDGSYRNATFSLAIPARLAPFSDNAFFESNEDT